MSGPPPPPPPGRPPPPPPGRPPPPAREPDEVIIVGRPASPPPGWGSTGSGPPGGAPGGPTMRTWTWSSASTRRGFPWFAILLILLGVGLLIELLVPELSFGSLVILAAGIAFLLAWLLGRIVGATVPALVLLAWGGSRIATELEVVSGDGWSTFAVGIALLIGWGLARYQRARREWALWVGLLLTIIGLADVSDALPFSVDVAILIPLAIIALGIWLVWRNRASFAGGPGGSGGTGSGSRT